MHAIFNYNMPTDMQGTDYMKHKHLLLDSMQITTLTSVLQHIKHDIL